MNVNMLGCSQGPYGISKEVTQSAIKRDFLEKVAEAVNDETDELSIGIIHTPGIVDSCSFHYNLEQCFFAFLFTYLLLTNIICMANVVNNDMGNFA